MFASFPSWLVRVASRRSSCPSLARTLLLTPPKSFELNYIFVLHCFIPHPLSSRRTTLLSKDSPPRRTRTYKMSAPMTEFVLRPKQAAASAEQGTKDAGCDSTGGPSKDVETLQDSSGERIGEAVGRASEGWTKNSLLKQVNATSSDTGAPGEEDDTFIIAGCCEEGRLLGLRLSVIGTEITKSRAEELAEDEEAVFVLGLTIKIPAWITASYLQFTVRYDDAKLKAAYIAKLQCSEFDPGNHYQLLQTNAVGEGVSDVQWKEAVAAGDRDGQSERIQAKPPFSPTTDGQQELQSIVTDSGIESSNSNNMEEHPTEDEGKDVMPSTGLKGRGVATMFGGMDLGAIPAASADPSASFEGASEAFAEGRKRKFSEDSKDGLAGGDEAGNGEGEAEEREGEADGKTKKKLKLVPKKPSAREHSDVQANAPGQTSPKNIGTSAGEPISHIDEGSATTYTEAEGKNMWASAAWAESWKGKWMN